MRKLAVTLALATTALSTPAIIHSGPWLKTSQSIVKNSWLAVLMMRYTVFTQRVLTNGLSK